MLRILLLAGIVVTLGLFLRGSEKFTIPQADESLYPRFPGGSTVVVEELDADEPLQRGIDVVYAMEKDGTDYARFGRIRGLPGDEIGAQDGRLTVNGEPIGPIPMPGSPMGTVPEGKVFILAINPAETRYPDSRELGFIPRERLRAVIRYRIGG
ncbi:MAG: S26 family signal peptidase [Planctomycetota bacterium]